MDDPCDWSDWQEWNEDVIPDDKKDDEKEQVTLRDFKKATALVLPSGGVKGVYILGALHYLVEEVGINHIKTFYGTSIGAIISGLLIIGYNPMEILIYICIHKIVNYLLDSFTITKIFTEKRFLDSNVFLDLLSKMIKEKIGDIPTLGDLFTRFGKKLCICTISRDNPLEPIYISSDSHPSVSLVQALHMSASIPFIFGYANYDDKQYFDGGVLDQFPMLHASMIEKHLFGIDIVRCLSSTNETIVNDVLDIISLPINYISYLLKKQLPSYAIYIEIHTENEYTTKGTVQLIKMFTEGYHECKQLLHNHKPLFKVKIS